MIFTWFSHFLKIVINYFCVCDLSIQSSPYTIHVDNSFRSFSPCFHFLFTFVTFYNFTFHLRVRFHSASFHMILTLFHIVFTSLITFFTFQIHFTWSISLASYSRVFLVFHRSSYSFQNVWNANVYNWSQFVCVERVVLDLLDQKKEEDSKSVNTQYLEPKTVAYIIDSETWNLDCDNLELEICNL